MRRRDGSALISALMLLIVVGVLCGIVTIQCVRWRKEYRTETQYTVTRIQLNAQQPVATPTKTEKVKPK